MSNFSIITGQTKKHLIAIPPFNQLVHKSVVTPLNNLRQKLADRGFDLQLASAFRSFQNQKKIWSDKAEGRRPLLNDQGLPLPYSELSPYQITFSILRWSALPGASRHHWGTDLDVFDKAALPTTDYQVQLIPDEVAPSGMFGPLHAHLDELITEKKAEGFFRPYSNQKDGVAPERWHLSFAPLSHQYLQELSLDLFIQLLHSKEMCDLPLIDIVKESAEEIYHRFVIPS